MRNFILSLSVKLQLFIIIFGTIIVAFATAIIVNRFFTHVELISKTGLITSIYQVLGTIYAVLIAFSVSGVWQNYCDAELSVMAEVAALVDLIHTTKAFTQDKFSKLRDMGIDYIQHVLTLEWQALAQGKNNIIMAPDSNTYRFTMNIVHHVQDIQPVSERDNVIFAQTLTLLNKWMDARRKRIIISNGNIVKSLWPLLIAGAVILFAFHGLFIAENHRLWSTLMIFFSGIIGLTFYLIFTLDAPFSGVPAVNTEPFEWALIWFRHQKETSDTQKTI